VAEPFVSAMKLAPERRLVPGALRFAARLAERGCRVIAVEVLGASGLGSTLPSSRRLADDDDRACSRSRCPRSRRPVTQALKGRARPRAGTTQNLGLQAAALDHDGARAHPQAASAARARQGVRSAIARLSRSRSSQVRDDARWLLEAHEGLSCAGLDRGGGVGGGWWTPSRR